MKEWLRLSRTVVIEWKWIKEVSINILLIFIIRISSLSFFFFYQWNQEEWQLLNYSKGMTDWTNLHLLLLFIFFLPPQIQIEFPFYWTPFPVIIKNWPSSSLMELPWNIIIIIIISPL